MPTTEAPLFSQSLALLATGLLVFISFSVIYLSFVEWKDRRRRKTTPNSPR